MFDQLRGPKRLVIVDGARYNESLSRPEVWDEITRWTEARRERRRFRRD